MLIALLICVAIVAVIIYTEGIIKSLADDDWLGVAISSVYGIIVLGLVAMVVMAVW